MVDFKKYGINMWTDDKIVSFRKKLLNWYDDNKRDLPWRRTNIPYHIWVSEIMLQQTRVNTVILYYERFLSSFPNIKDLSEASDQDLLTSWEGLGYYSRVRNMKIAAQQIMNDFGGHFPHKVEDIKQLKGVGPYTVGAIASIAFNIPIPAVDGNVMRIIARLFEINYDISVPANRKIFQSIAEVLIDPRRPGDFNQALMDLGSDIESSVNPRPEASPIKEFSSAYLNGTMNKYPIKTPKKKPTLVYLEVMIIQDNHGAFLFEKEIESGLLFGFWHFPLVEIQSFNDEQLLFCEITEENQGGKTHSQIHFEKEYGFVINWVENTHFERINHVFSHRKWQIQIRMGTIDRKHCDSKKDLIWLTPSEFSSIPFSKVQKKIWDTYYTKRKNDE